MDVHSPPQSPFSLSTRYCLKVFLVTGCLEEKQKSSMGLIALRCRIKKQTRAALRGAERGKAHTSNPALGTLQEPHRSTPRSPGSGAGRPWPWIGKEERGGSFQKREQRLLRSLPVVPLSLPNANLVAVLRRKLCPQCREKREGQESGSVSHGGQEGNRNPASHLPGRNSQPLSPGAQAVPS